MSAHNSKLREDNVHMLKPAPAEKPLCSLSHRQVKKGEGRSLTRPPLVGLCRKRTRRRRVRGSTGTWLLCLKVKSLCWEQVSVPAPKVSCWVCAGLSPSQEHPGTQEHLRCAGEGAGDHIPRTAEVLGLPGEGIPVPSGTQGRDMLGSASQTWLGITSSSAKAEAFLHVRKDRTWFLACV